MSGSVFNSKTGEDHPDHSLSSSSQYMKVLFDIPRMRVEGRLNFMLSLISAPGGERVLGIHW